MSDKRLLDKTWRLSHLYKIKDKNKQLITFRRNRAQEHFNKNKWYRNIILKSRQLGFTTDESMDMLDDTLFTKNFDCLLIAEDKEKAIEIFDKKIDLAWQNFKLKALYSLDNDQARKMKFGFGDGTFGSILVDNSGRSGTFHRVHITELALVCKKYPAKAKEIIEGTIPAVPVDGRIDIESTAEEDFGLFHDMFWEAWNRGNPTRPIEFKAHFYNWTWDDEDLSKITDAEIQEFKKEKDYIVFREYQIKNKLNDKEITYYYFKWLSLNKNWASLRKQYPTTPEEAFASAGEKVFDKDKLLKMVIKEGQKIGDWIFYEDYKPNHHYGIGADVAEGIGRDSSTATIWDYTTGQDFKPKVVAEYCSSKIAPDMFAYELRDAGNKYGTCVIAVERNNPGHTTLSKLKEIYPAEKIYKEIKTDKVKDVKTEKLGWLTTGASKPDMIYDLNTALNEESIDIPSKFIVHELKTYPKDDLNRTKAIDEETKHWDRVMATAIGWKIRNFIVNDFPQNIQVVGGVKPLYGGMPG